jgi:hypothetical protein
MKQTNLKNFGVEYVGQSEIIKEKMKKTNLKNFGVENPFQNKIIKEKIKQTNLKNFGVENPMQNIKIMDKQLKNSYKLKTFVFPSGNSIKCQGYEPFGLKQLVEIEKIYETDIITGVKNVPTIWYLDNENKKHRHYVDIFISSQKRCIEIKSTYTFDKGKCKNYIFEKQKAAKELGYKYEIWIYDKKGIINSIYD